MAYALTPLLVWQMDRPTSTSTAPYVIHWQMDRPTSTSTAPYVTHRPANKRHTGTQRTPPKVEALNTTKLKNQQQQEKIESIFFFCREEAKGRSKF